MSIVLVARLDCLFNFPMPRLSNARDLLLSHMLSYKTVIILNEYLLVQYFQMSVIKYLHVIANKQTNIILKDGKKMAWIILSL